MNQGQGYRLPGAAEMYQQTSSSTPQQPQHQGDAPPPPNTWPGHEQQQQQQQQHPQEGQSMLPKPGSHPQPVVMLPVMYHQLPQPGVQPPGGPVPAGWPQYAVPPQHQFPPQAQFVYPTPTVQYSYPPHYPDYSQYHVAPPGQQQHQQPGADRAIPAVRPFGAAFGSEGYDPYGQGTTLPSLRPGQSQQQVQVQHQDNTDSKDSLRNNAALMASRAPVPPYAIATTNNNNIPKRPKGAASPPENNQQTTKKGFRNSRRRHRNSHLGCATCKSRRIKCDEQLPECRNCIRARLTCAYLALDDAAREALKVAQQAHAARIQSLNLQSTLRELEKPAQQPPVQQPQHYPYEVQGLPSRIFNGQMPQYPHQNAQPIEINLQRAEIPTPHLVPNMSYAVNPPPPPLPQQQQPQHQPQAPQHFQPPLHDSRPTTSVSESASTVMTSNTMTTQASEEPNGDDKGEAKYAIQSDSYASLAALLKDHKDVGTEKDLDQLPHMDSEFTEIVLDPDCMMTLNKYWPGFDKGLLIPFDSGFEKEDLYKEYDQFHKQQMKEAENNVVLFKSILCGGASLVHQQTKNDHAKELAKKFVDRDLEITLRFLNKFRAQFNQDISDIKVFYMNVSICFSIFQTFQTAFITTFYGDHSLNDNYEFINRFFDFLSKYLNAEFQVFLRDDLPEEVKENKLFKRAEVLNSYMHVFIIYYVQCIKSYHTKPYNTVFMTEFLIKLKAIRPFVFNKVNQEDKDHYDNLVIFISECVDYWSATQGGQADTNRIQVMFYLMKKFLSLIPEKSIVGGSTCTFEQELIYAYYHAAIGALKAIYAETRFFFLFSFNGRDGTRTSNHIVEMYDQKQMTDSQRNLLKYPITVIKYFKDRSLTFSQYLKNVSKFPAKIMLDDNNRQILTNLVQEQQLESFNGEIKQENYPHIEHTSNFYDKETNSILIPSVSTTATFSNFDAAQAKRSSLMKTAVNAELSDHDKKIITAFFGEEKAEEVAKGAKA